MANESFQSFESTLRTLFQGEKYAEIIELIDTRGGEFPEEHIFLVYWQIGMAARLGNHALAYRLMDGLLAENLWISQVLLRGSPSLESLQEQPEFEARVTRFLEMQARERTQLLPLLTLRHEDHCTPQNPCPLLLGLHAERAISLHSIKFWQAAAETGWLVGVPQSSQALWSEAYVWEDRDLAQREIAGHLADLASKYPVDGRRIILAGHANGGELAIWLPISGGVQVRGFIAINPTGLMMADPNQWLRLVLASKPEGLRGAILIGEQDTRLRIPELKRTIEIFNQADIPVRLENIPGAARDFQPAYEPALLRAIDFVLS